MTEVVASHLAVLSHAESSTGHPERKARPQTMITFVRTSNWFQLLYFGLCVFQTILADARDKQHRRFSQTIILYWTAAPQPLYVCSLESLNVGLWLYVAPPKRNRRYFVLLHSQISPQNEVWHPAHTFDLSLHYTDSLRLLQLSVPQHKIECIRLVCTVSGGREL